MLYRRVYVKRLTYFISPFGSIYIFSLPIGVVAHKMLEIILPEGDDQTGCSHDCSSVFHHCGSGNALVEAARYPLEYEALQVFH
jgi:hypothetical protein